MIKSTSYLLQTDNLKDKVFIDEMYKYGLKKIANAIGMNSTVVIRFANGKRSMTYHNILKICQVIGFNSNIIYYATEVRKNHKRKQDDELTMNNKHRFSSV